ncbi:hypothetical protein [Neptunomonas sp.]|uniref:hypothetical protein n=1 Tax=Neptunomonas sp. TaxID=1971898 RepID=UPI0025E40FC4|nr:hypothetical protein [Neptunomonas sp.]
MYTNEDLNDAVKKGIFSVCAVDEFRAQLESAKKTHFVDEENFRLVSSFNDIFVVIACSLLLFSSLWVGEGISEGLGGLIFALLSWLLAEVFTLKRKMALPSIALLLAFVGGVFSFCLSLFDDPAELSFMMASTVSAIAAWLHWKRFGVPITIAATTAALTTLAVSVVFSFFPDTKVYMLFAFFLCGVVIFSFAMYWDSSDITRTTRKSDVAFWLHLLAAPLIIHPVFTSLDIFEGNENLINMLIVIVLYICMTLLSIIVDRRAFMVSSLAYVIYAITVILNEIGGVGLNFALTGIFIGSALLVLSVYWHAIRAGLLRRLPLHVQRYVPTIN